LCCAVLFHSAKLLSICLLIYFMLLFVYLREQMYLLSRKISNRDSIEQVSRKSRRDDTLLTVGFSLRTADIHLLKSRRDDT
jgi:biopolymer transport protein ExbB/TolQ